MPDKSGTMESAGGETRSNHIYIYDIKNTPHRFGMDTHYNP